MRALGLLTIVVLVALGATWWLAWTGKTPAPTPAAQAGAGTDRDDVVVASGAASAEATEHASNGVERSAVVAEAAIADDARGEGIGIEVEVVTPDQRPVAGVEVRYWPPRSPNERRRDDAVIERTDDIEAALRATGKVAKTDARGQVTIRTDEVGSLCARRDDDYAELRDIDLYQGRPKKLVLVRDATLRVAVTDTSGAPCPGIDVVAASRAVTRSLGIRDDTQELGSTNEAGEVALRHLQRLAPLPGEDVIEWSLAVVLFADRPQPIRRPVTVAEVIAGTPIRLEVPAGGRAAVQVVEAMGRPCAADVQLLDEHDDAFDWLRADPRHGRVAFHQVPPGRRWTASASLALTGGKRWASARTAFVGPRSTGETVDVRVVLPCIVWTVTGTVRSAVGEALPRIDWRATATAIATDGARFDMEAYTDIRDGRIRWNLVTPVVEKITDIVLHATFQGAPLFDLPVARELRPEAQDLGEIVVPAIPDLQELATVEVRLAGDNVTATTTIALLAKGEKSAQTAETSRSIVDGRMVLRGPPPGHPLHLYVSRPGAISIVRPLTGPGERVVVELEPAAQLIVPIVTRLPSYHLEAELEPIADGARGPAQSQGDEQSQLYWERLPPGRYRLHVTAKGREVLVTDLPPLVAGDNRWPTNGGSLDLRDRMEACFVAVRNESFLLPDATLCVVPAGAVAIADEALQGDDPWLVLPDRERDVLVFAPGYVPQRVARPAGDIDVTLSRLTTLQLQETVGAEVALALEYLREGVTDAALRQLVEKLDPRQADFALGPFQVEDFSFAPGTELRIRIQREGRDVSTMQVTVGTTSPQIVTIR